MYSSLVSDQYWVSADMQITSIETKKGDRCILNLVLEGG